MDKILINLILSFDYKIYYKTDSKLNITFKFAPF